jgi:hypothetical protein
MSCGSETFMSKTNYLVEKRDKVTFEGGIFYCFNDRNANKEDCHIYSFWQQLNYKKKEYFDEGILWNLLTWKWFFYL